MPKIMKISEAVSLALHGMAYLAAHPERIISVREMTSNLHVSEAHLSKVLQRLAHVGLARSNRGPRGGFVLGKKSAEITLLDIYEAIEGPVIYNSCLFDMPICTGKQCIFGDLLETTNKRYKAYLEGMKLSELTDVYREESARA
jgi:Rrf2 family nitric oxide-sensitive transcriptional repressor